MADSINRITQKFMRRGKQRQAKVQLLEMNPRRNRLSEGHASQLFEIRINVAENEMICKDF